MGNRSREFSTEDIHMNKKHLRKYLLSLAVREMQSKTTLKFHLTTFSMASISKTTDESCWQGCGDRGHSQLEDCKLSRRYGHQCRQFSKS